MNQAYQIVQLPNGQQVAVLPNNPPQSYPVQVVQPGSVKVSKDSLIFHHKVVNLTSCKSTVSNGSTS